MSEHEHYHHECHDDIKCCCHKQEHEHSHDEEHEDENALKKIILSALFFVAGLVIEHLSNFGSSVILYDNISAHQLCTMLLFFAAFIIIARDTIKNALDNIHHGEIFDEQFLMTVASVGAVCIGQIPEAVAVMLFYHIGEFFEDFAVDKSKDSINALMEICPDKAFVLRNGETIQVKADEVKPGETVIVKPGERIPVDGKVSKGKSLINNSALTGESVPVEVFEGNDVFSGAINTSAVLEILCLRPASDSAASRILKLVEESSEKKTRTERFITRFSRVYTPIVCAAALLVAVAPTAFFGFTSGEWNWSLWIHRALMFLVVSCPCALVISVPLTFFGGIGSCSKKGILVKGSSALESLANIKTAVFDKTGTLTKGVFKVTEIHSVNPELLPEDELVALAAHAETYSNHPAAVSLKKAHTHSEKCTIANVTEAEEIGGHGIKVNIDGKIILAGNDRLMRTQSVKNFSDAEPENAGTVVHVAKDGEYCGYIVISDESKEDAVSAIKKLKKLGVRKLVMLTGDNNAAAEKTAKALGLTDFYAQLLPENKVEKIEELLAELHGNHSKETVAFAGDGINDAPVLARADVGIAMGALGSDAAIESADVVIMTDEPSKIAEAIKTSRKTISIVYQNIVFSLAVKVAIMILSAAGITNMWIAVFGDVGVSMIAILNAARALKK